MAVLRCYLVDPGQPDVGNDQPWPGTVVADKAEDIPGLDIAVSTMSPCVILVQLLDGLQQPLPTA